MEETQFNGEEEEEEEEEEKGEEEGDMPTEEVEHMRKYNPAALQWNAQKRDAEDKLGANQEPTQSIVRSGSNGGATFY